MLPTIVIALGGTGGHVLPAQKIGDELSSKYNIIYMGVGLSKNRFFEKKGIDVDGGGLSSGLVNFALKNVKGIIQAKQFLKEIKPKFVIGFGSFHSFPVLSAAAYLNIPYYLFEFNVVPGRVNRLFSQGAEKVFVHFKSKRKKLKGKLVEIDYAFEPIKMISKEEARKHFGLDPDRKTLLVFGGSQGAEAINRLISQSIKQLEERFQILHFSGGKSFCTRMDLAWSAADLAICRAGAGAMREVLIYEKPAILIPYPEAKDDHQRYNADYIEEVVGGGICLSEKGLTADSFVKKVFEEEERIKERKEAIRNFKKERPSFKELL